MAERSGLEKAVWTQDDFPVMGWHDATVHAIGFDEDELWSERLLLDLDYIVEWIEPAGDRGKVGITDYAQQQLGDVVFIELPEVGTKVKAGQSFGTIESVKAVSELYAPVTGEVVEVNGTLKDKPESVNSNPHTSWMIVVRLAEPAEVSGLLDAAQYTQLVSQS